VNSGVNNSIQITTDDLIRKEREYTIPNSFSIFVRSEVDRQMTNRLFPSRSIKTNPNVLNLFGKKKERVNLGIPDLRSPQTPTIDINRIEQSRDTIESLDVSILSRAVSVGRTFVHTKSYIDVRDHINNLMNPVNEVKDLSELLQKMQPKKGKPNDKVVRNPIMNYLKLKKSTLDKNQSRLMISPPIIDDDFKEEEEAGESDDDFIDDKIDQTEESDDDSTDRDGFASGIKEYSSSDSDVEEEYTEGESDEEDPVDSNILCDKCGKNSFGSSYNSVKYDDGKVVTVNCCSSKCFAKIKF